MKERVYFLESNNLVCLKVFLWMKYPKYDMNSISFLNYRYPLVTLKNINTFKNLLLIMEDFGKNSFFFCKLIFSGRVSDKYIFILIFKECL